MAEDSGDQDGLRWTMQGKQWLEGALKMSKLGMRRGRTEGQSPKQLQALVGRGPEQHAHL